MHGNHISLLRMLPDTDVLIDRTPRLCSAFPPLRDPCTCPEWRQAGHTGECPTCVAYRHRHDPPPRQSRQVKTLPQLRSQLGVLQRKINALTRQIDSSDWQTSSRQDWRIERRKLVNRQCALRAWIRIRQAREVMVKHD